MTVADLIAEIEKHPALMDLIAEKFARLHLEATADLRAEVDRLHLREQQLRGQLRSVETSLQRRQSAPPSRSARR